MRPININLHIEELVLNGFFPFDRYVIGDAVQRELSRLLANEGLAAIQLNEDHFMDSISNNFVIHYFDSAESIGFRLGQAIYQGINQVTNDPTKQQS